MTPFGRLMTSVTLAKEDGATLTWHVPVPAAMLAKVLEVTAFADIFLEALRQWPSTPASPWRVIYYADEATSGNLLHRDPSRKSMCIYWTFQEFPLELRSKEAMWFIGGIIKTRHLRSIEGGLAALFASHLRLFFGGDADMRLGILLPTHVGPVVLCAKLGTTLADEDALKALWCLKGASGMRPCACCFNIVGTRSGFDLSATPNIVDITCTDVSRFQPHTNASYDAIARRLSTVAGGARDSMETRL